MLMSLIGGLAPSGLPDQVGGAPRGQQQRSEKYACGAEVGG